MQKKLISLAVASALAIPGVAMADLKDVEVYGRIHASWDFIDNESTGDDFDDNTGAFRNSRLGFKGSEKINENVNAIWQIETLLSTGSGTDPNGMDGDKVSLRNTFVGLQGDNWGTVAFGKHDTPYKLATQDLDIFIDTIADYNNIIGAHVIGANVVKSSFNNRASQTVMYKTPNFSGFQAAAARISVQNDETTGDDMQAWSAMAVFDKKDNPFFASLAYELFRGGIDFVPNAAAAAAAAQAVSSPTQDLDAWKLGLGYKINNSKIGFVYEDIDLDGSGNSASRDAFMVNFAHDFGSNTVKLAYARADDSDAADNDGAENWSVGLDHNFSDRTKMYGIFSRMSNESAANYGLFGGQSVASGTNFASTPGYHTGNNAGVAAGGKDIHAVSFGIIHSF